MSMHLMLEVMIIFISRLLIHLLLIIMWFTASANKLSRIGLVIAIVSLVILLTTIFFITLFGCIFCRLWQKQEQSKGTQLQSSQLGPSTTGHSITSAEQDLEMMENVAYGPLKWTNSK